MVCAYCGLSRPLLFACHASTQQHDYYRKPGAVVFFGLPGRATIEPTTTMETRSMTTLEVHTHPARTASPCRRRLISLGVLAMLASLQAQAQETASDPAPENVVVVTGFRASLNSALTTKKNSDGIVDSIKAEDIAKFPDANLAESLQRVPGVALARGDGGEGKQITVRGLNAGFTRVRINGIEGVAATGASDINGSTNRGRGFDFSVFASELFNSLEVRKTSEAAIEEGSLGATVDLRTARPFDYKGRTASIGGQAFYNELSQKTQPRFTGLFSDRWDTDFGKVGALVSGAFSKRRATEEGYEAVEILSASNDGLQRGHGPHRQLRRHRDDAGRRLRRFRAAHSALSPFADRLRTHGPHQRLPVAFEKRHRAQSRPHVRQVRQRALRQLHQRDLVRPHPGPGQRQAADLDPGI
jgi:hypothetical protein